MFNTKLTQSIAEAAKKVMDEKLHPNQQKLDVHEPEKDKLTTHDFKKLRAMKKEETEQIQELSTATMKSYVKGAKSDVTAHKDQKSSAMDQGDHKTASDSAAAIAKRQAGMKVAKAKMNNEETEQIQEYTSVGGKYVHRQKEVKDTEAGVTDWDKEEKMSKDVAKPATKKRAYGAHQNRRTNTKLYKEMIESLKTGGIKSFFKTIEEGKIEQIEELKKSTLGSYVKKASSDLHNQSFDHGEDEHRQYGAPEDDPEAEADMQKRERDIENRKKGITRAVNKLTKEEASQEEFTKEMEDQKAKFDGKKKGADFSKPPVYTVKQEEVGIDEATHTEIQVYDMTDGSQKPQVNIVDLEEKSLTDAETAKKEEIVKSMKKGLQGFKDRYGDRAKQVMYATATKTAKEKA
jgi:hypothetical protein